VTNVVRAKDNFLVVKVDNQRHRDGVPTDNTDWWNYGGLTRDVRLVEVPGTFIRDYAIQLAKGESHRLSGWVQLDGPRAAQDVTIRIGDSGTTIRARTDADGLARFDAEANVELWSPQRPKLYAVEIAAQTDRVEDRIGFRALETKGADILLNGSPSSSAESAFTSRLRSARAAPSVERTHRCCLVGRASSASTSCGSRTTRTMSI